MFEPMHNKLLPLTETGQANLFGAWLNLASPLVAEAIAAIGYDWVLIDAEHGPNDISSVLSQLQAVSAYPTVPVVRIPNHDASVIKRYLDIGAHNLLVPMVDTKNQARQIVEASRYPKAGIRGVGAGLARASRWSLQPDYLQTANASVRLILQIESEEALHNLPEILTVEGIAAVFFGPADIAASKGLLGDPSDARIREAVIQGIKTACDRKIAAGVFSGDQDFIKACELEGARLLGVTSDVNLLVSNGKRLLEHLRQPSA
ncbi:MAG: hypothetical protein ISR27_02235 [Pseudomonadales bacterium]|jgi:4-hydroxy-2-oxoheptanedioate aldolase|nr:hypothetical protein [Pseudomonadales bacterium]MDB3908818.1 aldolase/citrate lyase family protein [Gammaproteobacteria bacterium]